MTRVSNINLFVSSTPYHIIVSCAFMNEGDFLIIEDNKTIDDYILEEFAIKKFKKNIIHVNYYRDLFSKNVFIAQKNFNKINILLSNKNVDSIYVFNDAEPYGQYLFKKYKKANHCVLEEGIGLYNDMYHRKWLKKIIYGKLFFGFWYSVINRIGEYKYSQYIYAKDTKLLTNKQLTKKIILENYEEVNKLLEKNNTKIKKNVWFISQPLIEDEICDSNLYYDFFKKFIFCASKNNINIALKPHPRENMNKYQNLSNNIEIIDKKNIPFELLLDTSKKVFLFTVSSSAVFKFDKEKNVNIYFLHNLINTKIDYKNISCNEKRNDIVDSFESLEKIMEEIANENKKQNN